MTGIGHISVNQRTLKEKGVGRRLRHSYSERQLQLGSQRGIAIADVGAIELTQLVRRSEALHQRTMAATEGIEPIDCLDEVPGRSETTLRGTSESSESTHRYTVSKEHKPKKAPVGA